MARWPGLVAIIAALCAVFVGAASARPPDAPVKVPDPNDTDAVIAFLITPDDNIWGVGHKELHEVIRNDPARFAAAIREQLMRLPATLDEYSKDHPSWSWYSITEDPDVMHHIPSFGLLALVRYLGLDHGEPILREFYNHFVPIAEEARRRYEAIQPDPNLPFEERLPDLTAQQEARQVMRTMWHWRNLAVMISALLHSTMFVDETLFVLNRADEEARDAASQTIRSLLALRAIRPDIPERLACIADRFEESATPDAEVIAASIRNLIHTAATLDAREGG